MLGEPESPSCIRSAPSSLAFAAPSLAPGQGLERQRGRIAAQSDGAIFGGGCVATRGFSGRGRGPAQQPGRLPPGQFATEDFPVLSAGPTPRVAREDWSFTLKVGPSPVKTWSWS